jgi:hypothetical protein
MNLIYKCPLLIYRMATWLALGTTMAIAAAFGLDLELAPKKHPPFLSLYAMPAYDREV